MSDIAIQINNVSKLYRLGTIGTGSLKQDITRWWHRQVRGSKNDFFEDPNGVDGKLLWALRDINLEIRQGEIWGIVGSNGAGKSTLLKIISRIVRPTTGEINGRGLISSLLEVGTGFHQELTGRENIYLNGALLGMSRNEVKQNFDSIIAFSGIERFIDTPVKRYSSGMYVRLAFAVAAHLRTDILIVDEVLAVGDAEFQKKCLGKVNEVSRETGRTILFVSHNMSSVRQLCTHGLWLKNGRMEEQGAIQPIINRYLSQAQQQAFFREWEGRDTAPGNSEVWIQRVELVPNGIEPGAALDIRAGLRFHIRFWNEVPNAELNLGLHLFNASGDCIFDVPSPSLKCAQGWVSAECEIPGNFLNDGAYSISVIIVRDTAAPVYYLEHCLSFEMADYRPNIRWSGRWMGAVRPLLPFHIRQE